LSETYNSAAIARHAQGCRRRTHQCQHRWRQQRH